VILENSSVRPLKDPEREVDLSEAIRHLLNYGRPEHLSADANLAMRSLSDKAIYHSSRRRANGFRIAGLFG